MHPPLLPTPDSALCSPPWLAYFCWLWRTRIHPPERCSGPSTTSTAAAVRLAGRMRGRGEGRGGLRVAPSAPEWPLGLLSALAGGAGRRARLPPSTSLPRPEQLRTAVYDVHVVLGRRLRCECVCTPPSLQGLQVCCQHLRPAAPADSVHLVHVVPRLTVVAQYGGPMCDLLPQQDPYVRP